MNSQLLPFPEALRGKPHLQRLLMKGGGDLGGRHRWSR